MNIANSVLELIGRTPLVRIHADKELHTATVLAKLERNNPMASVKDRPALSMIEDAETRGLREGELARIWNERGATEAPVHLNWGIRPGVVHVIEGRCVADDPWMNLVTDDGVTDMGYGATFYECLVEVGPA